MAVKKISRWELESASSVTKGDQRDSWKEHTKMTVSAAPIMQGKQVAQITVPAGTHSWFLDDLLKVIEELRGESPQPPRSQIKD